MPYDNMKMYSKSDERELDLREIDKYDSMNPELFYDYVDRLEHAKSFLDTHVKNDKDGDLKRSMLAYSGLAGGMTNFWANPYDYTGVSSEQAKHITLRPNYDREMDRHFGYVGTSNPYNINLGVKAIDRAEMPSTRVIPHEMSHTKELLSKGAWIPNFSPAQRQDLVNLRTKAGPYYQASGLGDDPGETMAYLRGREGELRQGKTLRDDPAIKAVFDKHPGMYEEYQRSSNVLKGIRGRK